MEYRFHDYKSNVDNTKEVKILFDMENKNYLVEYYTNNVVEYTEVIASKGELSRNLKRIFSHAS